MPRLVKYETAKGTAFEAFVNNRPIRGRDGLAIIVDDNRGSLTLAECERNLAEQVMARAGIQI